jgi:hypothetical protein
MPADLLEAHADLIRESGVLGRSFLMARLFDLLVSSSLKRGRLSEQQIAERVFRRNGESSSADAKVRVYMYRLRKRLDVYYAGRIRGERLTIPLGDYRLVVEKPARSIRDQEWICPHCLSVVKGHRHSAGRRREPNE